MTTIKCESCGTEWEVADVVGFIFDVMETDELFVVSDNRAGFDVGVDVLEALEELDDNGVFLYKRPKCQKENEK